MTMTKDPAPFSAIRDHHDLLAAMPAVLGYRPAESVVVAACDGKVLILTLRIDIDWFLGDFEIVSEHLLGLRARFPTAKLFLLGYTEDLALAELSCSQVIDVVGEVADVLVTNGIRWWSLRCTGDCCTPEGHPFSYNDAIVTAEAVFAGVPVARARGEAVKSVFGPLPAEQARLAQLFSEAAIALSLLSPEYRSQLLNKYLCSCPADQVFDEQQCARIATLLSGKEELERFTARLSCDEAGKVAELLLQVCACCPAANATAVVAALAWAAWLSGGGAVLSAALERLSVLAPDHFILHTVGLLIRNLVSPADWCAAR